MGPVKTFKCPWCFTIWSTPKRRKLWRWFVPWEFNRIPCPDCYVRYTHAEHR